MAQPAVASTSRPGAAGLDDSISFSSSEVNGGSAVTKRSLRSPSTSSSEQEDKKIMKKKMKVADGAEKSSSSVGKTPVKDPKSLPKKRRVQPKESERQTSAAKGSAQVKDEPNPSDTPPISQVLSSGNENKTNVSKIKVNCTVCGKELCNKYSLKNHMLVHSDEKGFECEVCQKQFNTPNGLRVS